MPDFVADNLFFVAAAFILVVFLLRMPSRWRRRLRGVGRDVDVVPEREELRRGEELRVHATRRGGGAPDRPVRLGLVCVERYDVEVQRRRGSSRSTREAIAYESWQDAEPSEAWSAVFAVPADAPYTYAGACLSFDWHVEARELERFRPDSAATKTLAVRP